MSQRVLVGIDIGTTGVKAVLLDRDCGLIAQSGREYKTAFPQAGYAEQDPGDWWDATCEVLNRLLSIGKINPGEIAGVGVSSQAPTMLPVNRHGEAIHPALIWMDRRTEQQCRWLREHVDEGLISNINGGRIDPYYLAPKLLWFKEHEPELYQQTHVFLQANGYIVSRLTSQFCTDRSHGPLTLIYDSQGQAWSEQLIEAMGLDLGKIPPVVPCEQIVGEVTHDAAHATGLPAGTPVIAGMVDATAAAVEAGILQVGESVEMTGQSSVLMVCSNKPYLGRNLIPLGHAIPDKYLIVGAMVASGGALRWFRDQLGGMERKAAEMLDVDAFDLLTLEASKSPPGANKVLFLPYMFGERSPIWDNDARGVFIGLSLATTKADLIRAIMEGAAFGLRHNLETIRAEGFAVHRLKCTGGTAKSKLWNQIKADVLNRTVSVPQAASGAPWGDAILAAVAVGLYPSVESAVKNWGQIKEEYWPDTTRTDWYEKLYQAYVGIYPALKAHFNKLAAIGSIN